MKLKILSWNIWVTGNFDQISNFLESSKADIIGLQEVQDNKPNFDVKNFLTNLGYKHVFASIEKVWDNTTWNYGPAIFTKHEVVNKKIHELSEQPRHIAVEAGINIDNKILHVFSTHLVHTHQQPSDVQDMQAENLIKILPKKNTIVMGDFNALPGSSVIQNMQAVLVNAGSLMSPTAFVYPAECCNINAVEVRLDYIFFSKDIKILNAKVEISKASDHLPISAEIEI